MHLSLSNDDIVGRSGCLHQLHSARFLSLKRKVSLRKIVLNPVNPKQHDGLPMALRLLVPLSSLLLEDDCFRALDLWLNCRVDSSVLDLWATDCSVVDRTYHENVIETDLGSNFEGELLDSQDLVVEHLGLLSGNPDDGKDLIRVRWQCDALLWAVHVNDRILAGDWLPIGLSDFSLSLFSRFSFQWGLPPALYFLVLRHCVHGPSERFPTRLIQVFKECTHASLLNERRSKTKRVPLLTA